MAHFVIPQAKLNIAGIIYLDVRMYKRYLDATNKTYLTDPSDDKTFVPRSILSTNSTGLNLQYIYLSNDDEKVRFLSDEKSVQRFTLNAAGITGASLTGLANDGTLYTCTFFVKGTEYAFSAAGSTLQTYTALLSAINTLLSGIAVASLVTRINEHTHIQILLSDFGLNQTIDGTLFSSLGATIDVPIHNKFDYLPLANNTQLNDDVTRHISYIAIKTPGGAASAALDIYCTEYRAL